MVSDKDQDMKTIGAAFKAAKNSKSEGNFEFYIFQTDAEKFLSMAHAIEHMADEVALFSDVCSEKLQKRLSDIHWQLCQCRCHMLDVADIAKEIDKIEEESEAEESKGETSQAVKTTPNKSYFNSIAGVYASYKHGDMRFPKGNKQKPEDDIVPIITYVVHKTDHIGTLENMPFFIKSIIGGLIVIMRIVNKQKSDDFIAACKAGWYSSGTDPLLAFRDFLIKHGPGRSVKDNVGRALFGHVCLLVIDAWWHGEPLTLKDIEAQMYKKPEPMRFAPVARIQLEGKPTYPLIELSEKKIA